MCVVRQGLTVLELADFVWSCPDTVAFVRCLGIPIRHCAVLIAFCRR